MPDQTAYASAPAPVPQKRRSFAGAIVLIAIGVVFLLGNMHVITWASLWRVFAHYWPVLLILYGIVKLVEYYQAKNENRQFAGIGGGGVVLIIFIIIFGLSASGIERVRGQINWNELNGDVDFDHNGLGSFLGNTFTFSQELEQDFPAGSNLKVVSDHGSVTVTAWDQSKIRVQVNKKVRADNQEDANKVDQGTQAQITLNGTDVTVNANLNGAQKPVASDLQIFIPRKASVAIDSRHGDVVIADRQGNVKISNSGGDVNLSDITGNADVILRPSKGSVHATKLSGDLTIDGRVEDTTLSEIGGAVHMTGDYFGDMSVSKVAKGLTFKSSRTDLEIAKLDGEMSMQSGDLRLNSVTGPIRLTTRSKDIELNNFTGDVKLENSNGTVQLRPAKLGEVNVINNKGDVQVTLPAKSAFQLDARTRHGEISTDFNELHLQTQNEDHVATGTVGSGGPRVQIVNAGGDVSIRKG